MSFFYKIFNANLYKNLSPLFQLKAVNNVFLYNFYVETLNCTHQWMLNAVSVVPLVFTHPSTFQYKIS